jgi:agmatinase
MKQPSYSGIRTFLQQPQKVKNPDVSIIGIPFDLGTTNRPGARMGPKALREASTFYTDDWHPTFKTNPCESLKIQDLGDLDLQYGYMEESLIEIEKQIDKIKGHIITLGGDHTVTLPVLRSLRKKVGKPISLVHFDAHVDTWDDNFGSRVGHGTPFHFAVQEDLIDPKTSIQIGIRSPVHPEVMKKTYDMGFLIYTAQHIHNHSNLTQFGDKIKSVVGDNPTYLTFDIDCIDPSQAPGTGTPEIGGLFTWQVLQILESMFSQDLDWVGMDLVEVAPVYDVSEITSQAGACFIWNYLCMLGMKKQ